MKFYTKDTLTQPVTLPDGRVLDAYLPADALVDAVNLAMLLKRPLLLMGEPGCGKTQLAEAVAYALHGKDNCKAHFFDWYIKSTSKAKDGLYTYDALERLRDANAQDEKAKNIDNYIKHGKLYEAFEKSQTQNEDDAPIVILIDEIDKADLDFPNDLLLELDKKIIKIEETRNEVKAGVVSPLIIITSNREKELPPAFLRRCLYHYIEFPNDTELQNIVKARVSALQLSDEKLTEIITRFKKIRDDYKNENAERNLSTSELIDWLNVINKYHPLKGKKNLTESEQRFVDDLESLDSDVKKIPFYQILIKNWDAYNAYKNATK